MTSTRNKPKSSKRNRRDPVTGAVPVGRANDLKKLVSAINRWREYLNPLRGFTISRAIALIEQGERGEFADLQWAYRKIERSSPTMIGLVKRWGAAMRKLDWEIKTVAELPEGATQQQAEAQQKTLRAAYDMIGNLREAVGHLNRAKFRGFAHIQKHRNTDGDVVHLEPLDQWNFVRDGIYGDWYWNPGAEQAGIHSPNIILIEPDVLATEFIVREEEMPVDEVAIRYYAYEALGIKDWAGFVEIYGIPSGIVIMPPNIPNGKESEYETTACRVSEGSSGALPNGSDYKTNDQPRGTNPFKEFLDYTKEQIVLAGTSGKLTMLNDPTGLGSGQSDAHQDTFDDLAEAEALEISELFQRCFDAEILEREHEGEPVLAYFELCAQTDEDVDAITEHASKLSNAGYQVSPKQLSEKTGYEIELKQLLSGQEQAHATRQEDLVALRRYRESQRRGDGGFTEREDDDDPMSNRAAHGDALPANALPQLGQAVADDLQPLRRRLEAILQIDDPEIQRNRLVALRADLPQLIQDINADPEAARVIEETLGAALSNGLEAQI